MVRATSGLVVRDFNRISITLVIVAHVSIVAIVVSPLGLLVLVFYEQNVLLLLAQFTSGPAVARCYVFESGGTDGVTRLFCHLSYFRQRREIDSPIWEDAFHYIDPCFFELGTVLGFRVGIKRQSWEFGADTAPQVYILTAEKIAANMDTYGRYGSGIFDLLDDPLFKIVQVINRQLRVSYPLKPYGGLPE